MRALFVVALTLWSAVPVGLVHAGTSPQQEQLSADARLLDKALTYFASEKYHEALLIFEELDGKYRLNPRYRAYLGVCYYYEWNYEKAIAYLDKAIPHLENFSPFERSFYYWANAESHFLSGRYKEAVPLYGTMLTLCHENEKPDAYYRIGFCHMFAEDWQAALRNFQLSLDYYTKYRNTPETQARIQQIRNMINGCKEKTGILPDSIPPRQSTTQH